MEEVCCRADVAVVRRGCRVVLWIFGVEDCLDLGRRLLAVSWVSRADFQCCPQRQPERQATGSSQNTKRETVNPSIRVFRRGVENRRGGRLSPLAWLSVGLCLPPWACVDTMSPPFFVYDDNCGWRRLTVARRCALALGVPTPNEISTAIHVTAAVVHDGNHGVASAVVETKGFVPTPATLDSEVEGEIVKEDGTPVASVAPADSKPKV